MTNSNILLKDIVDLTDYGDVKVKFNKWNGEEDPLTTYLMNPDEMVATWTSWRGGRGDFRVGQAVIVLMKMQADLWLLTGIRKITADTGIAHSHAYSSESVEEFKKYYGRVIIKHSLGSRQTIPFYSNVCDRMEVYNILPERFSGRLFPGVTNIRIPLSEIVELNKFQRLDWITPLKNQKGIYLITDKEGKQRYVGSAYGGEGLWQRWLCYANTGGTGGNVELMALIEKDPNYGINNFEYAVLETFGSNATKEEIISRESWWKETLGTRSELNRN